MRGHFKTCGNFSNTRVNNILVTRTNTGQTTVADTIMRYLLSDTPWKMFYPNDNINSSSYNERRNIVVDAYFNTSDKGVCVL